MSSILNANAGVVSFFTVSFLGIVSRAVNANEGVSFFTVSFLGIVSFAAYILALPCPGAAPAKLLRQIASVAAAIAQEKKIFFMISFLIKKSNFQAIHKNVAKMENEEHLFKKFNIVKE